jgi:hypothetical protein
MVRSVPPSLVGKVLVGKDTRDATWPVNTAGRGQQVEMSQRTKLSAGSLGVETGVVQGAEGSSATARFHYIHRRSGGCVAARGARAAT